MYNVYNIQCIYKLQNTCIYIYVGPLNVYILYIHSIQYIYNIIRKPRERVK